MSRETDEVVAKRRKLQADQMARDKVASDAPARNAKGEEPDFVDEPDLPAGEPSGEPTSNTKEQLDFDKHQRRRPPRKGK